MSIISITWARNEEDIIESFVRHNVAIVDRMIVVLHRCTDDSFAILTALQNEGFPITVQEDNRIAYQQSSVMTQTMHTYVSDADWIVPLDADEFLVCDKDAFAVLDTNTIYTMPWRTYVPTPNDNLSRSILEQITHRRTHEPEQYYKVIIPRSIAQHPETALLMGSHGVLQHNKRLPHTQAQDIVLAHFPVRSESQLRKKIINGCEAHLADPDRNSGEIYQWHALYDRCKNPEPIDASELQTIAMNYAIPEHLPSKDTSLICDPIHRNSAMRC